MIRNPSVALADRDAIIPWLRQFTDLSSPWFGDVTTDAISSRVESMYFGDSEDFVHGVAQWRVSWAASDPDQATIYEILFVATCPDAAPSTSTTTTTTTTTIPGGLPLPDVVGQSVDEAILQIFDRDLTVSRIDESSDAVPAGEIIRTDPPADTIVQPGTEVVIVVSSGP